MLQTLTLSHVRTNNTLGETIYFYLVDSGPSYSMIAGVMETVSEAFYQIQVGEVKPVAYNLVGDAVIVGSSNFAFVRYGEKSGQLMVTYGPLGGAQTNVVFES